MPRAHPEWLDLSRPMIDPVPAAPPLTLLSIVIPARDEEGLHRGDRGASPSRVAASSRCRTKSLVVDDGSTDRTLAILEALQQRIPELRPAPQHRRSWPSAGQSSSGSIG